MGNTMSARKRPKIDEQYTRPQGLYPDRDRDVDAKKLRRLILDGKLAPCYPGKEDAHLDLEECPICFLHYPSLNNSRCCKKGICTECFLQMKSPIAARPTRCPFCKTPGYAVEHGGPKSAAQKAIEVEEDQRVIEATLRMRQEEQLKSEERAKRREKDLSEGRVPEPPSPTLFPATPPRFPAFAPPAPAQPSQSANTPQQTPASSSQGGIERSGSGGMRRMSFPSRRVSAIEPDNLWFRAGSAQASASHSHRPSAVEQSAEASPSTADSWATLMATAGSVGLGVEGAEDGGAGPMAVLRAMANRDPYEGAGNLGDPVLSNRDNPLLDSPLRGAGEVGMDLDDVMLNEAIWLSLQEEEERQRRSSGSIPPLDNTTGASVGQARSDEGPVQGYRDPDEAAASELARALAASLEQNAAWGSGSPTESTPLPDAVSPLRGSGGGFGEDSGTGVAGSSSAHDSGLASVESRGLVYDGSEGFGGSISLMGGPAVRRRLETSLDAEVRSGGVNGGEGSAAAVDGTAGSGTCGGAEPAEVSGLTQASESERAGGVAGGLMPEQGDRRSSGNLAESSSTGPLDLSTDGAEARPMLPAGGSDVSGVMSAGSDVTPEASGAGRGLPLFGHLRADSVYRSTAESNQEGENSGEGLVSSTIGPVEPLSLEQLGARQSITGPYARVVRESNGVETEAQPKGGVASGAEGSVDNVSISSTPGDSWSDTLLGGPTALGVSKAGSLLSERKDGGDLTHRTPGSSGVGSPENAVVFGSGPKTVVEGRPQSEPGAQVATQGAGDAQAWLDSGVGSWERFTDGNAFAPSNPFAPMHASAREQVGVEKPGLSPHYSEGSSFDTRRSQGTRASSEEAFASVNPLGVDGDLYPSSLPTVAKNGMGKDLGSGGEGVQKRRARSLSGSSNKVHGEPWTSTIYSPVKYPPPRTSTGPDNLINAGKIYQRSVSSRDSAVATRSEALTSSVEAKQVVPHVQTVVSDASFEEQLSAAIALSLAEVEAEEERRKQHEAFEREAFLVGVETQTLS